MSKMDEANMRAMISAHLTPGETVMNVAYGVKPPSIFIVVPLLALAILPGFIAIQMLTKHYVVARTSQRVIFLKVKGIGPQNVAASKDYETIEFTPADVADNPGKTKTGILFTNISFKKANESLKLKFHRAFSKANRAEAMAIGAAVANEPMPV